jgi:protein-S-isoprenylcysteine O-methyltransferase Ste14
MYGFLIPLLLGFLFNSASAFTSAYSRRRGERGGRLATLILRNVVGIPLWVVGLAMAVRTHSPALFRSGFATGILGWLLVGVGSVLILAALLALRWRAAAPSVRDSLVEQGPYAHVRHPIYSGMLLEFAGLALVVPTQAVALACALGVVWILIQARLEERDLLQRLPPYREYMERVPRFIPRLRRRQPV